MGLHLIDLYWAGQFAENMHLAITHDIHANIPTCDFPISERVCATYRVYC
jgi:hypothetical protein